MEEKTHSLTLNERSVLTLNGIADLITFDENGIVFDLGTSTLTVTGNELCVTKLSLSNGEAVVSGNVDALVYTDRKEKKKLFSRFFG